MLEIGTLLADRGWPSNQGHVSSSNMLIVVKIDRDKDSFLTISRFGSKWWPLNYINYILMIVE